MMASHIFKIRNEYDIINVRMQVREKAGLIGMDLSDQARISLATSSLMEGLGIGAGEKSVSIVIENLEEGSQRGLQIVCSFHDTHERKMVEMVAGKISWMVDHVDIRFQSGNQVEIVLTKWSRKSAAR